MDAIVLLKEDFLEHLKYVAQQPIKNNKDNDGTDAPTFSAANFFGAPAG